MATEVVHVQLQGGGGERGRAGAKEQWGTGGKRDGREEGREGRGASGLILQCHR